MSQRPPVEIKHSFESGKRFWVQLRYRRSHEAEAFAAADRRARTAAWDSADVRTDITAESRNWRTAERWYARPLNLHQLVSLDASELETEQALVGYDASRIHRMCDTRLEYDRRTNPLFAAAGALDEVCVARTYLGYLFDCHERDIHRDVADAATEQEVFQMQRRAARLVGPDLVAELTTHCAKVYPDAPHYRASFWRGVLQDPRAKVQQVRELDELRRQNAARHGGVSRETRP